MQAYLYPSVYLYLYSVHRRTKSSFARGMYVLLCKETKEYTHLQGVKGTAVPKMPTFCQHAKHKKVSQFLPSNKLNTFFVNMQNTKNLSTRTSKSFAKQSTKHKKSVNTLNTKINSYFFCGATVHI